MAVEIPRDVFAVVQTETRWTVRFEGEMLDDCVDRAEAVTSATRRARARSESGHPSRIVIEGEAGYFR